jgi:hypothetical protein
VEATIRQVIADAAAACPGVTVDIKRLLLARALQPLPGNKPLVEALQKHGQALFGEPIPASGTPLYTDVRLYCERGIPAVIYGNIADQRRDVQRSRTVKRFCRFGAERRQGSRGRRTRRGCQGGEERLGGKIAA